MKTAPRRKTALPATLPLPDKANARQSVEKYVRENPIKAVGQAAAVGFLLRLLPVRTLLSTAMRLALPATCLAVAMKSWTKSPKPPTRSQRRGR